MRTLQDLLLDSGKIATKRDHILYEIHYRVPRRLPAPFLASHFTQIRRSPEDKYFEHAVGLVKSEFSHGHSSLRDILSPTTEQWRQKYDGRIGEPASKIWALPRECFIDECTFIADKIRSFYSEVLKEETALFVFGSLEHILDWIARRVTDETGDDPFLDYVFKEFCVQFSKIFTEKIEYIFSSLRAPRAYDEEFESQDYGSVRRWLENDGYISSEGRIGPDYGDFHHYQVIDKNLADPNNPLKDITHQIRWSRFPQAWNYTFLEFPNEGHTSDLQSHMDMILASIFDPSVINSARFPEPPPNRHFPGKTLAGAHYLLLPIEDLLTFAICTPIYIGIDSDGRFDGDKILQRVSRLRHNVRIENSRHRDRARDIAASLNDPTKQKDRYDCAIELLSSCLRLLGFVVSDITLGNSDLALPISQVNLRSRGRSKIDWDIQSQKLVAAITSSEQHGLRNSTVRKSLGHIVQKVIESTSISAREKTSVLGKVSNLTKSFWMSTYTQTVEKSNDQISGDFVSSSMVEGRCVYFSNFLPFGDEKFTRTIFVDIGMTDYQRSRVLQRLCDVLTYRSVSIRDLDRVRSGISALNDLTRELNNIQMKLVTAEQIQNDEGNGDVGKMDELRLELEHILNISIQMGRLNAFFTYGIAGRWSSTSAFFEQIIERCEDLRETRLLNYPPIADFLKRRLKHSIRYVERLHVLHEGMGHRITELLDRVRTRLESLQTEQMLNQTQEVVLQTEHMAVQTKQMRDWVAEQASLMLVAEFLVMVGGTYYIFCLVKPFQHLLEAKSFWVAEWPLVFLAFGLTAFGRHIYRKAARRKQDAMEKITIAPKPK